MNQGLVVGSVQLAYVILWFMTMSLCYQVPGLATRAAQEAPVTSAAKDASATPGIYTTPLLVFFIILWDLPSYLGVTRRLSPEFIILSSPPGVRKSDFRLLYNQVTDLQPRGCAIPQIATGSTSAGIMMTDYVILILRLLRSSAVHETRFMSRNPLMLSLT